MQRTAISKTFVLGLTLALGIQLGPALANTDQSPSRSEGDQVEGRVGSVAAVAVTTRPPIPEQPLESDLEQVKKHLLELKRDLVILEEDLLYPASTQVAVFLSMDLGELFRLDSVTLKLNGREVTHHLYTNNQVDALYRGGIQKLWVGNVKQGNNRLTAFFTGRGPSGRDYRRATTVEFDKSFEPTFVELAISDSTAKYQPEFRSAVTN